VKEGVEGYHFLMVDLVKLLVKYDAKVKCLVCCFEPYSSCIQMAANIGVIVAHDHTSNVDVCHSIMDSIASLYRYLLLADAGISEPSLLMKPLTCKCVDTDDTDENYEWNDSFTCYFIHLADYSSEPGASTKMIKLLLSTMSQDEMNLMRIKFLKLIKLPPAIDSYDLRSLTPALEWICSVSIQFSLENLSLRKIMGALDFRSVCDVKILSIPKLIEEYALFNW